MEGLYAEQKNQLATKTIESPSHALVLPSVKVPEENHQSVKEILTELPITDLSTVDSVTVVRRFQQSQNDTFKALKLAQYYRDIAERMNDEKLESEQRMKKEVKTIRNFWRNNIMEGSTRAGRMVKKALKL